MQIDVPTLYCLTIGTLCLAVAMTLWERKAHPTRAIPLGIWAVGYGVLAFGCTVMLYRASFPGISGMALTNVAMVTGYLMVFHGAVRLDGGGRPLLLILPVVAVAAVWAWLGQDHADALWQFGGAMPISFVSFATALVLWRSKAARTLRSRPLAIAIHCFHGVFYLVRCAVVPVLAARFGPDILVVSAKITMFEAVLFSVAMPMAFLALVREEAQGQLLAASQTDYLTGLGNRHALFEHGARVLESEAEVTLLAFDLDHFKAINDRHGHAVGDKVLKLFAQVIRAGLGPKAMVARLGGEEFAALLPGTNASEARPLAEALCRSFVLEAARPGGLALTATVSVGVAERRPDVSDLQRLLAAADKALYRAKALGRDRVEVAAPPSVARAA